MYDKAILKYPNEFRNIHAEFLGLATIPVLIEDTSPISNYFRVSGMLDEISDGKYGFIIDPDPSVLKLSSQIKAELIMDNPDENGNIVTIPVVFPKSMEDMTSYGPGNVQFTENASSDGYSKNTRTGRDVQIIVYNDIPHGMATLTLVGEALQNINSVFSYQLANVYGIGTPALNGTSIPKDWQGVYNVRWSKRVFINKSSFSVNKADIIFYNSPVANVYETTSSYKQQVVLNSGLYTDTSSMNVLSLESIQTVSPLTTYALSNAYGFNPYGTGAPATKIINYYLRSNQLHALTINTVTTSVGYAYSDSFKFWVADDGTTPELDIRYEDDEPANTDYARILARVVAGNLTGFTIISHGNDFRRAVYNNLQLLGPNFIGNSPVSASTISIHSSGFTFDSRHVGANVLVNKPVAINTGNSFGIMSLNSLNVAIPGTITDSVNIVTPPSIPDTIEADNLFAYRAVITDIVNSSTARVTPYVKHFLNPDDKLFDLTYFTFAPSIATMSYYMPEERFSHVKLNSFINLDISNLKTLSGQVTTVKVLYSSAGAMGDFLPLAEHRITTQNLLVDNDGVNIGTFPTSLKDLSILFKTESFSFAGSTISPAASDLTMDFSSDISYDSAKFIASGSMTSDEQIFYKITHIKNLTFSKDTIYNLSFDSYVLKYGSLTVPSFEVYMSGSAFYENNSEGLQHDLRIIGKPSNGIFGKHIIKNVNKDMPINSIYNFKTVSSQFKPNQDGTGSMVFIIKGQADWVINNISIDTQLQKGFSPSKYSLRVMNPSTKREDALWIKTEFYNPINVAAVEG